MRSLVCACVAVAAVSALQPVSRRNGLKHLASGGAALAPLLYPAASRNREDLWLAGVHFHLQLKRQFPKFYLRDSLAQTCWIKRGVTS